MKKIAKQMSLFYAPICPAYDRAKTLSLTDWYRLGSNSLDRFDYPKLWAFYPPAVSYIGRTKILAQTSPAIQQRAALRLTLTLLAALYLPFVVGSLVLVAVIFRRPHYRQRLGWLASLMLFVYTYNAAACLEVAIVNSLEVPRFSTVQLWFTLLAQFLTALLLCEIALEKRPRHANND